MQIPALATITHCVVSRVDESLLRHTGALPQLVTLLRAPTLKVQLQAICAIASATAHGTLLCYACFCLVVWLCLFA